MWTRFSELGVGMMDGMQFGKWNSGRMFLAQGTGQARLACRREGRQAGGKLGIGPGRKYGDSPESEKGPNQRGDLECSLQITDSMRCDIFLGI